MSLSHLVSVLLLLAGGGNNASTTIKIDRKWVRTELETVRKKYDLPAMGAAVVTSDGLQLVEVVGVRKRGNPTPVTVNDRFHLGSETKAMTATLIAVLVQQGKLKYDQTLSKVFPELKVHSDYRDVTIEQVLAHRAGFPPNAPWGWWSVSRKLSLREQRASVAQRVLTKEPPNKAGEKFIYSNVGYTIAGHIAERLEKATWETLMQKHIFRPLKMTTAGFGPAASPDRVDQPYPHDENGKPVKISVTADNPPVMGPAGRVHASLGDWAKFIADQLRGAKGEDGLLKAGMYRRLQTPYPANGNYSPGGWLVVKQPGGADLTHDGSNTMNHCTAWLILKRDVAVMVVCNQGGEKAQKATHAVRDAILNELAKR